LHATLPLLKDSAFPAMRRGRLTTLQANLGYKCNQACFHCHVNAGPDRKEMMDLATINHVIAFLQAARIETLDITGGAPELNAHFRALVRTARGLNLHVMDRCNLTVLLEPGQEDLGEFLAEQRVEIVASLPCYSAENVDKQRGENVYDKSIAALKRLNALGYGQAQSNLVLNLVYNPLGASLPPAQASLEADYKRELAARHGITFNHLYTLANMPIQRFGSTLISQGKFASYMTLLKGAHRDENLDGVMCRSLLSVDYQGYVYDCDFNQMLKLPLQYGSKPKRHLSELLHTDLQGNPIVVADHCYGCTAGQGSSCGGSLS
jgi:radical SAM/Cys-rich protein